MKALDQEDRSAAMAVAQLDENSAQSGTTSSLRDGLTSDPILERALRRVRESLDQETHMAHHTKHTSHSTHSKGSW
jgi:hypothetical protein